MPWQRLPVYLFEQSIFRRARAGTLSPPPATPDPSLTAHRTSHRDRRRRRENVECPAVSPLSAWSTKAAARPAPTSQDSVRRPKTSK